MTWLEAFLLAVIQGLTEFLPISSSAHLILPSQLLGWEDQGLAFDVAVHVGSLVAVVTYFHKEVWQLAMAWFKQFGASGQSRDSLLAWAVIIGVIPAGVIGYLVNDYVELYLRSILVIAITTLLFGVLLGWSDKISHPQPITEYQLTFKHILIIGFAQALALIPGTSRSGITMTAGRFLGMTRQASARYSFLLSIPLILAAGAFKTLELAESPQPVDWWVIFVGFALAAVSAYVCIAFFLKLIDKIGMMPFVIYRLGLGMILLVIYAMH
tara:strand:- start:2255 stop:3061 length:807 start_codon:yes stop_codon:yes gene_type:complete